MKKILLGLGTLATVIVPLATATAFGSNGESDTLKKMKIEYDNKTNLISIDCSVLSSEMLKEKYYKDILSKITKEVEIYNKNPNQDGFDKIEKLKNSIPSLAGRLPAGPLKVFTNSIGKAIRTHPNAIGIIYKYIGDGIIKKDEKFTILKNQVEYSLRTFNVAEFGNGHSSKVRETFTFGIGEEFKMPEHGKWCTSAEFLRGVSKEELEKPIKEILKNFNKNEMPKGLSSEQMKDYPKLLAQGKALFSNPSHDMQIYYYVNSASGSGSRTEAEFEA